MKKMSKARPIVPWRAFLLGLLGIASIGICACSSVSKISTPQKKSEIQETKQMKKLIVQSAPGDDRFSGMCKLRLQEKSMVSRKVREFESVSVQKYPYSFSRKLDEMLIGILGAPFTPIAMVGGIVNRDANFAFFPLTALYPFKNFRPDKAGLFSGPIQPEFEKRDKKENWKNMQSGQQLTPIANTRFEVKSGGKTISVITDHSGVIELDLQQFPDMKRKKEIKLVLDNRHGLKGVYTVPHSRIASVKKSPSEALVHVPQGKKPIGTVPKEVPPLPKPQEKVVAPPPAPVQEKVAPLPPALVSQTPPSLPSLFEDYTLFKVKKFGYWVDAKGFPLMALVTRANVTVYADEYLRFKQNRELPFWKEHYVFGFSFDPVRNILLSLKVGTSHLEGESYGWVLAEDVCLWNTSHRLKMTKPVALYSTYESCVSGKEKLAYIYFPDPETKYIHLPVLEKKGIAWLIAYPVYTENKHTSYRYGWIRWAEEPGVELEDRIFKHKLDIALRYLEKNILWGESEQALSQEFDVTVEGPLCLKKQTGEMYFSAFNLDKKYTPGFFHARLMKVPTDSKSYEQFQSYVIHVGEVLSKDDSWDGGDVIYFPIMTRK